MIRRPGEQTIRWCRAETFRQEAVVPGCGKVCVSSGSSGGTRTLPTDSITACGFDQLMGISRLSSEAGATSIMTNAASFASAVIAKTMMASRNIMHSSIRPTVF